MTSQVLEIPSDIAFRRLQALVQTGYRPRFGETDPKHDAFFVSLAHPRASRRTYVPRLTLWSDGILATDGLLWPEHHVPSEKLEQPAWQKFILADDQASFDRFVSGVLRPSLVDLYVRPRLRAAWDFVRRFAVGSALCVTFAGGCKLIAIVVVGMSHV